MSFFCSENGELYLAVKVVDQEVNRLDRVGCLAVKFLVDQTKEGNINLDSKNKDDMTGFQLAFENKHNNIVNILLKESVKRRILLDGTSIFHDACNNAQCLQKGGHA